ncbi:MAG: ribosome maturation factor RimM [Myxococcota bacterium]
MAGGKGAPGPEPIAFGVVTRPHGVRGEVRVHPYNPDSDLLLRIDRVWLLTAGAEPRQVVVERARRGPHAVLVQLEGVRGREQAEALRGVELGVERESLPPAEEDEWYVVDLVGAVVRDPQGTALGEVVDVIHYPSVDCLQVRTADGDREVPMVEPWLQEVDADAGEIRVSGFEQMPRSDGRDRS